MSWYAVGSAAISIGSSYLTKDKGGKDIPQDQPQTRFVDSRNPDQQLIDANLSQFINKYLPQFQPGEPYTGQFTAPSTSQEKVGLSYLDKYLSGPDVGAVGTAAGDYATKTLAGGFNPNTSDYYSALRDQAMYNRTQATNSLNADLGSSNKFFSSERVNKQGDINTQTGNYLNTIMASLADQERNRQQQVFTQAPAIENMLTGAPLRKSAAAAGLGGLERNIQQSDLEKQYQEFARQQKEKALPLTAATGAYSNKAESQQELTFGAQQPTFWDKYGNDIIKGVVSIASNYGSGS